MSIFTQKIRPKIFWALLFVLLPVGLNAYQMPQYKISKDQWSRPSEEIFAEHVIKMNDIDCVASISRLENHSRCHNCRLSKKEKAVYPEYLKLKVPYRFWEYVVNLKKDLVKTAQKTEAENEADIVAKLIIEKIYALSNEYEIAGSALLHNTLINLGMKKKGFCYHYTDALRKMLLSKNLQYFDLHWGAAYDKTFLENNGLVISGKNRTFESGIVIDSWRTASKPYWNKVKDDRFPWKELYGVEIQDDS